MEQEIFIKTPFIKLGSLLKLADIGKLRWNVKNDHSGWSRQSQWTYLQSTGEKIVADDIVEIDLEPNIFKIRVMQEL